MGIGMNDDDKLPKLKIFAVCVAITSASCFAVSLFSFVGFMVDDFGVAKTKEDIGYFAGYLGSAYFLGAFFSGYFWGWVADKKGRKPVLIFSLFGSIISSFMLGFSLNYPMAMVARLLGGLLDNTFPVCRTILGDLTTPKTRAQGFAFMGFCWGLGNIIGPFLGGFLSQLAEKAPGTILDNSLTQKFPYAAPCIANVVFAITAILVCSKALGETKAIDEEIEEAELKNYDSLAIPENNEGEDIPTNSEAFEPLEEPDMLNVQVISGKPSRWIRFKNWIQKWKYGILVILLLPFNLLNFTTLDEVLPIWLMSDPKVGGFNFDSQQIGIILTVPAIYLVVLQLWGYKIVEARVGIFGCLIIGFVTFTILGFAYPCVGLLNSSPKWMIWTGLIACGIIRHTSGAFCFTSINILIPIVGGSSSGKLGGIANAIAGLVTALGPGFGTSIFAWSVNSGKSFPLNYFFIFLMLVILNLITFAMAGPLRKYLKQKHAPEEIPVAGH